MAARRWAERHTIVNPLTPPVAMEGEGVGPAGPFFPSSARTNVGGIIPANFFMTSAACGRCHNARLDQSLSRARFHTDLERLPAEERQTAIERLSLPGHDPLAMPPRRIHDMSDAARDRLIALLRR